MEQPDDLVFADEVEIARDKHQAGMPKPTVVPVDFHSLAGAAGEANGAEVAALARV